MSENLCFISIKTGASVASRHYSVTNETNYEVHEHHCYEIWALKHGFKAKHMISKIITKDMWDFGFKDIIWR